MGNSHGEQSAEKGLHPVAAKIFANEAARNANGAYYPWQITLVALQQDTNKLYWLASVANAGSNATPTWLPFGAGGGLTVVETSAATASVEKGQLLHVSPANAGSVISAPASPTVNDPFSIIAGSTTSGTKHVSIDVGTGKINGAAPSSGNVSRAKITSPNKRVDFIYSGSNLGWLATPGDAFVYQNINPNGVTLTYASDGDANGVFYYIGTNNNAQAWSNPHTSGNIVIIAEVGEGSLAGLVDRSDGYLSANGTITIDLGSNRKLQPNYYSIKSGAAFLYRPSNWRIRGSNNVASNTPAGIDAATWTTIDTKTNQNMASSTWLSSPLSAPEGYRWLQYFTDSNTSGSSHSYLLELEFYGLLTA